jgi:hypothetical protein
MDYARTPPTIRPLPNRKYHGWDHLRSKSCLLCIYSGEGRPHRSCWALSQNSPRGSAPRMEAEGWWTITVDFAGKTPRHSRWAPVGKREPSGSAASIELRPTTTIGMPADAMLERLAVEAELGFERRPIFLRRMPLLHGDLEDRPGFRRRAIGIVKKRVGPFEAVVTIQFA